MSGLGIVTFISDTGWDGGYAAVLEAVVVRLQPRVRVLHINHEVRPGDVSAAALTLARLTPLYPPGVHVAIIDPGVGTGRRPLALITVRGDILVGPDNGVLLPASDALGGLRSAWVLDPLRVRTRAGLPAEEISSTFHGRDVFAPTAALLTRDADPAAYAVPVDTTSLMRLVPAFAEATAQGAVAEVIEVDRFGNVGLALRFAALSPGTNAFSVEIPGEDLQAWTARVVRTYGELQPGELGVFADSWGQVALALNSASAAQLLSLERGMRVRLTVVASPPAPDAS